VFPPKLPKPDPLADAPEMPAPSRLRRVLLGLALIAAGVLTLAACAGIAALATGFVPGRLDSYRPSGRFAVTNPDSRLTTGLRLEKLDGGYAPGDVLRSERTEIETVSGSEYQLAPGEYRLRVKSDDVIVQSELIRITGRESLYRHEVKRGGILHVHADPEGRFMSVTINGETCVQNATQPSRRMLVVPEGTVRIKAMWGQHVFAERLVEVKAGEERTLRVTPQGIEDVPTGKTKP
jgi:hypothetical protein